MSTTMRLMEKVLLLLGASVRSARRRAGMSQENLAERAGLHRTYIGGIERGERNVSIKNLCSIARALDVPTEELVRGLDKARR